MRHLTSLAPPSTLIFKHLKDITLFGEGPWTGRSQEGSGAYGAACAPRGRPDGGIVTALGTAAGIQASSATWLEYITLHEDPSRLDGQCSVCVVGKEQFWVPWAHQEKASFLVCQAGGATNSPPSNPRSNSRT